MVLEKIGKVSVSKAKIDVSECTDDAGSGSKASRFFKGVLMALVLYLILNSDIFTETVMQYIPGSTDAKGLTVKGTVVHGIIFSIIWCLFMYTFLP